MDFDFKALVNAVKEHEVIWNPIHPSHKDTPIRLEAWKEVAETTGLTVETCRKKWKNIRDTYNRDSKKKAATWRNRSYLKFLDAASRQNDELYSSLRAKKRKIESAPVAAEEDDLDTLSEMPIEFESYSPTHSQYSDVDHEQKPKITVDTLAATHNAAASSIHSNYDQSHNMENVVVSTLETVQELLKQFNNIQSTAANCKDEDELFCMSLMQTIKKYPNSLRNKAKIGMLRYLNAFEEAHIHDKSNQ